MSVCQYTYPRHNSVTGKESGTTKEFPTLRYMAVLALNGRHPESWYYQQRQCSVFPISIIWIFCFPCVFQFLLNAAICFMVWSAASSPFHNTDNPCIHSTLSLHSFSATFIICIDYRIYLQIFRPMPQGWIGNSNWCANRSKLRLVYSGLHSHWTCPRWLSCPACYKNAQASNPVESEVQSSPSTAVAQLRVPPLVPLPVGVQFEIAIVYCIHGSSWMCRKRALLIVF
jgi:hypothetical protein